MINYELAKQLKEAGFPQHFYPEKQEGLNYYMYDSSDNDYTEIIFHNDEALDEVDLFYIPTLSELIEACGDKFDGIIRFYEGWVAGCNFGYEWFDGTQANGSTPEEAAAKLWLELNKK